MLKKYQGGASVKGGFYWNTAELEVVTVDGKNGPLPGGPTQNYLKVPALALIPLAMGFSALYVMFLHLIGFAMLPILLVRKSLASKSLVNVARSSVRKLAALTAPES